MGYKDPKQHSEYNNQWAKDHPKRVAAKNKKWRMTRKGQACQMHHRKAAQCREQDIEYSLSRDWYLEHLNRGCELTGIEFRREVSPYAASVDRVNPKDGYTPENSRMILFGLNALKGTGTDQDMYDITKRFISNTGGE